MATAFLFNEVFAKTGPLSRYLQSVNMNYAKALALIDSISGGNEKCTTGYNPHNGTKRSRF